VRRVGHRSGEKKVDKKAQKRERKRKKRREKLNLDRIMPRPCHSFNEHNRQSVLPRGLNETLRGLQRKKGPYWRLDFYNGQFSKRRGREAC